MPKSQQNNWAQYRPEQTQGGAGEIGAIVSGIVSRIQTVTLVRVVKTKSGGLAPVGLVTYSRWLPKSAATARLRRTASSTTCRISGCKAAATP